MFLIDDILVSPIQGLVWVVEEIHKAVEADRAHESDALTAKLSELYMMLESGQMSAKQFDAAEKVLLDRLDVLKQRNSDAEAEEEDDDEVDESDHALGGH